MAKENKRKTIYSKISVVVFAGLITACVLGRQYVLPENAGLEDYKKAYTQCAIERDDLKTELIKAMDIITNLLNCPKGE